VILPVDLTLEEYEIVKDHFRKTKNSRIREKCHAFLLSSDGKSILEIADFLYRNEKTVREWIKKFHQQRLSSLFSRMIGNQHAAKLTQEQKKEIAKILNQKPSRFGLPVKFWSVKELSWYIKAQYGVECASEESYRLVFKASHYSFHLPSERDERRDDHLIESRMEEIYQEVVPLLELEDVEVFVSDESRLVWEDLVRRAWLPKGKRTILKVNRERQYQHFLGFLNVYFSFSKISFTCFTPLVIRTDTLF